MTSAGRAHPGVRPERRATFLRVVPALFCAVFTAVDRVFELNLYIAKP
jgi:hypothetical protein